MFLSLKELQAPDAIGIPHKKDEIGETHSIIYPNHLIFGPILTDVNEADIFQDDIDIAEWKREGRQELLVFLPHGQSDRFQRLVDIATAEDIFEGAPFGLEECIKGWP